MIVKPDISSLDECSEYYFSECANMRETNATLISKRYRIGMFTDWLKLHGINAICEIDFFVLKEYQRYLNSSRTDHGEPYKTSYIIALLCSVTKFLTVMDAHEYIDASFVKKFKLPRHSKKNYVDVPNIEEVERICHQASISQYMGVRNRAIAEVFFATGIRRTELANLDIRCVDFLNETLLILDGKNGDDRVIPIAPRALAWVKRYLKEQRPILATLSSGDSLFLAREGNGIKPTTVTDMMSNCVKRSGINKDGACHILRHFTATEMIKNGANLFEVQDMLGHADISSTQRYVHFITDDLQKTYRKTHPAARS